VNVIADDASRLWDELSDDASGLAPGPRTIPHAPTPTSSWQPRSSLSPSTAKRTASATKPSGTAALATTPLPMHELVCCVLDLRPQRGTTSPPLNAVRATPAAPWSFILPSDLKARICAALSLYPDPAYAPANVSIRSTRAGGAMALLCEGVDSDRIWLLGRWRSDEMYRYLHVRAQPVLTGLSVAMLRRDFFPLTPA
jgi:hypothetical protein